MSLGRVWIVAPDHEHAEELAAAIASAGDAEPVCTALRQSRRGLCGRTPEAIFFDVRDETAWPQIHEWADSNRGCELVSVPWIAVTADSIPLPAALDADRLLSGFLCWPFDADRLRRTLQLARNRTLRRGFERLGQSRVMRGTARSFRTFEPSLFPILENLELAARHDFTILLTAETGTGKTTLAQIIHENSPRRNARFLTVPCASLPRELIESELFGHVKGAFTGADRTKDGKFDAARGGTILLDEIDALDTMQQGKLLRVLETGEFEPVGSNETRQTTARVIVASNFCLEKLVAEGKFRQDLFYRLHQVRFELPPLRDRPRDIVPLMVEFIEESSRENGIPVRGIDPAMFEALFTYNWPGNIRELRNELRRCVLFARDGIVRPASLSASIAAQVAKACDQASRADLPTGLAGSVAISEQQAIENMLRAQKYNRAATARALGISRVTLYNKLRRYNIRVDGPDEK